MKIYRRNSRKNPWRNTREIKELDVGKILARLLIFSIPIMLICLSSNLVLRLPDAYQYNLSATQSVSESGRVIKEDKLVELFADFMQGKTDKFVLMEDVEYQPENVFNGADQEAMLRLRFALNLILVAGIIALLVTAASYFFLIRWRKKALHMEYFKKSVWVFLLLSIANSLVKLVNPIREATWGKIFGTDFPKHDFLIEIFQNSFALHITIFDLLVSWILMGILAYGTWQVAGRKKIFKAF